MATTTIVRSNLEQLERWEQFYRDWLGLTTNFQALQNHWRRQEDLLGISIAEGQGFGRLTKLIVVPQGVTANDLYAACAKRFVCWRCVDDFSAIGSDYPAVNRSVACWIEPAQEAPEELANQSADDLKDAGITTLVFDGYLAYGLDHYFEKTGDHLDRENWTIFPGSRDSNGNVLRARWDDDGFKVRQLIPCSARPDIRGRAAVYV